MSPTPPTSQGSGQSPDSYKVVRKRNRVPLSCGPCRHRKLKCNRQSPCENCVKRSDAGSCTYASISSKNRGQSNGGASDKSSPDDMQSRIDRLESLVLSLMGSSGSPYSKNDGSSQGNSSSANKENKDEDESPMDMGESGSEGTQDTYDMVKDEPDDEIEDVRAKMEFMKVDRGKTLYRGSNHWAIVLSEISEVKGYLAANQKTFEEIGKKQEKQETSEPNNWGHYNFPLGGARHYSHDEILALLPPKDQVDLMMEHWFDSMDNSYHVFHAPTFRKQYAEFWEDPPKTSILWVALLFSIIVVALQSIDTCGTTPQGFKLNKDDMEKWRFAAEMALVAGRFASTPDITVIQCMIILVMGMRTGTEAPWLILGYAIRIAFTMGLHRDYRKLDVEMPPYQAEMRRRLWSTLCCMDILFSIKLGLPCMIRPNEADMEPPYNVHDYEFSESSVEMPKSRDLSEQTPMSYARAKMTMAITFGKIITTIARIHPVPPYEDVFALEKELREAHATIPAFLKMRRIEESELDQSWLISQRFGLDILFQKSLLVMHRPYYGWKTRRMSKYEPSRRICLEASMALMSHQSVLFDAQHGRLKNSKWSIEAITVSDILPATMIIMMELYFTSKETEKDPPTFVISSKERDMMLKALDRAIYIYTQSTRTFEMEKAILVLNEVAHIVRENIAAQAARINSPPDVTEQNLRVLERYQTAGPTSGLINGHADDTLVSEQSAAMTLGMMSSGGLTPLPMNMETTNANMLGAPYNKNVRVSTPNDLRNDLGSMSYFGQGMGMNIDGGAGIEWDEWDNFLQGINLDTSGQNWMSNLPVSPMPMTDGSVDFRNGGQSNGFANNPFTQFTFDDPSSAGGNT